AVLERVAEARRRLRARADDPPATVGVAGEVERDEMQEDAAGRPRAVARAQETGMPEDERRRNQALVQQRLLAIEIGGDEVEQPRTLPETVLQLFPLAAADEQRQDVERPRTAGAIGH